MPKRIARLVTGQAPTLLDAERANELVDMLNGLMQSEGNGGVTVLIEDTGKMTISASAGIPDGYVEKEVILCVDGESVSGKILFKEDEEE